MFDKQKGTTRQGGAESAAAADDSRVAAPATTPPGSSSSGKGGAALIGATITIKGDVVGDENLMIEGKVEGSVTLNTHELTIGQSGQVQADITAKNIRIDGEVKGDIAGREKVIISRTGNVTGNIVAPRVTLEDGAKFKGRIDMDPSSVSQESGPLERAGTASKPAGEPRADKDSTPGATGS